MRSPRKSARHDASKEHSRQQAVSLQSVVQSGRDTVSADLDGEAAILNLKDGVYYSLNPLGARIWTLIQKTTSLDAVLDTILSEYDVDAEICERDLLDLIQRLASAGLVDVQRDGEQGNAEAVGETA